MAKEHIAQTVKSYILEQFLPGENPDALMETTPLISGGILDSISTIKLVSFLEEQYKIEFDAHEINADHLDTVGDIVSIVGTKVESE